MAQGLRLRRPRLSDSDALLIARWDGAAAGYVAVSRDWTGLAIIDDIAVDNHARGQRIGAALIEAACGWALSDGLPDIRLETQSTNPDACRLDARCGFRLGRYDHHL